MEPVMRDRVPKIAARGEHVDKEMAEPEGVTGGSPQDVHVRLAGEQAAVLPLPDRGVDAAVLQRWDAVVRGEGVGGDEGGPREIEGGFGGGGEGGGVEPVFHAAEDFGVLVC